MTILILQHPIQEGQRSYLIQPISEMWERLGFRVIFHHGVKRCPPADLLILHVDLSLVPGEYLKVAARYPRVLNLGITDIRKTTYSRNRVRPGDGYEGPVIVKSALNFGGVIEQKVRERVPRSFAGKLRRNFELWREALVMRGDRGPRILGKESYRVYERRREVPDEWCVSKRVVVERFRPERHGAKYVLREWYFLGDCDWTYCETSDDPIFTSGDKCPDLLLPVPEQLRKIRKELGIDYGKMDFAFAEDGRPVLYDVNKTIGVWSWTSLLLPEMIETLSPGLLAYVPRPDTSPSLVEEEVVPVANGVVVLDEQRRGNLAGR